MTTPSFKTIEDLITYVYKMSLKCGIGVFEFWDYTLNEVYELMEAYNTRKEEDLKLNALYTYKQAQLNANAIACMFSKNNKMLEIWEVYPEFFKKEIPKQQNAEVMKARLLAYGEAWKKKKKGGKT